MASDGQTEAYGETHSLEVLMNSETIPSVPRWRDVLDNHAQWFPRRGWRLPLFALIGLLTAIGYTIWVLVTRGPDRPILSGLLNILVFVYFGVTLARTRYIALPRGLIDLSALPRTPKRLSWVEIHEIVEHQPSKWDVPTVRLRLREGDDHDVPHHPGAVTQLQRWHSQAITSGHAKPPPETGP